MLPKPSAPLRVADFATFMKEARLVVSHVAGSFHSISFFCTEFSKISKKNFVISIEYMLDLVRLKSETSLSLSFTDVPSLLVDDESVYNEQARKQLLRLTRYWPSKLNEAFIYNIPKVLSLCIASVYF